MEREQANGFRLRKINNKNNCIDVLTAFLNYEKLLPKLKILKRSQELKYILQFYFLNQTKSNQQAWNKTFIQESYKNTIS